MNSLVSALLNVRQVRFRCSFLGCPLGTAMSRFLVTFKPIGALGGVPEFDGELRGDLMMLIFCGPEGGNRRRGRSHARDCRVRKREKAALSGSSKSSFEFRDTP